MAESGGRPLPRKNVKDFYDKSLPENRWEVNYGPKEKFFLTDEEHKWFLTELAHGAEIIQVSQLTLTKRFNFILPLKNKPAPPLQYEPYVDEKGVTKMRLKQ